jgi:hypothetical protein
MFRRLMMFFDGYDDVCLHRKLRFLKDMSKNNFSRAARSQVKHASTCGDDHHKESVGKVIKRKR